MNLNHAFEYAILKLQCKASDILFIDDRLENIEVAKSLQMGTHHFRSAKELESILIG